MFGGNRKKKGGGADANQSDSGLFDLSHLTGLGGLPQPGQDEDDSALEDELAALMAGDGAPPRPGRAAPPKKVPLSQIDHLAAEAMQSMEDEEVTEDDLDDPAYLAELEMLSRDDADLDTLRAPPRPSPTASPQPAPCSSPRVSPAAERTAEVDLKSLLRERIQNYEQAFENAEVANESSKVRRYGRGLKTLKDLDKKVQRGMKIDQSEIPPAVAAGAKPPSAPEPAPPPPANETTRSPSGGTTVATVTDSSTKATGDPQMALLKQRQQEYKMAALEAKRAGNMEAATGHFRIAKQFDAVIEAMEQGEEVDLSGMPPPPSAQPEPSTRVPPPKVQKTSGPPVEVVSPARHCDPGPSQPAAAAAAAAGGQSGPPPPSTPMEALQQRHDSYKSLLDKATADANASKSRRLGRIVKSYQDAIKKEKLGRAVNYEDLAFLPGFAPIPPRGGASKSPGQPSPGQPSPGQPSPGQPIPGQPSPGQPSPGQQSPGQPSPGQLSSPGKPSPGQPSPGQPSPGQPSPGQPSRASLERPALARPASAKEAQNLKNLRVLVERQKQYKAKALEAKTEGDRDEAMRLLRIAKGFDSMITASENGLPVNMDSIPPLPLQRQASADGEAEWEECEAPAGEDTPAQEVAADSGQLYTRLAASLKKQVEICSSNEKQYLQLGNLSTSKRFGEMRQSCQQDLDLLMVARSHSDPVPRFHYESRTIPSIRVCPDLSDTEVELSIIRGTHLKPPAGEKELDTFVKFEFPYPSDEPQTGKTGWGKGLETVEYQDSSKLSVQRNRAFASCVKRRSVKFEVYYGRGFLRSDKLLAQASLKLTELENRCEIHESLPLYDGRKATGGKLEVKVRLHHPLTGVKEDQTKEKWLVINSTAKKTSASSSSSSAGQQATATTSSSNVQMADSLAVLNWELETLRKKVAEMQAQKRSVPKELLSQQQVTADRIHKLQLFLKEGGQQAKQAYMNRLTASLPDYIAQAKKTLLAGNKDKAGVIMAKKKLVENEIATLKR